MLNFFYFRFLGRILLGLSALKASTLGPYVLYNSHESKRALLPELLGAFAGDVAIMQDLQGAVRNRFSPPQSPPYPAACTFEQALELLRLAWSDCRYWFTLEELRFITAVCGPKTHIYNVLPIGAADYQLEPSLDDEGYDAGAILVAFQSVPLSGCGHFTRLFLVSEWEAMQVAATADISGDSQEDSDETEDTDGSISSSSSSKAAPNPASTTTTPDTKCYGSMEGHETAEAHTDHDERKAGSDLEWDDLSDISDNMDCFLPRVDEDRDFVGQGTRTYRHVERHAPMPSTDARISSRYEPTLRKCR